jgi:hypothetical protein
MKIVLLILVFILTTKLALSQTNESLKFKIEGKAFAKLSGRKIVKIEPAIVLSGTMNGMTDINEKGEFAFINLKPGKYKIEILSLYGYQDTTVTIVDKNIFGIEFVLFPTCQFTNAVAHEDINNGKPKLLIYGGIAPVYNIDQGIFEKKYGIEYYNLSDASPDPYECVQEYNKVIFNYLTNKYGKRWRKEVRRDVVGIKKAWR